MTDYGIGNYAGIVFFAIAIIGIVFAVMRRRVRILKPASKEVTGKTPETKNASIDELLDDLRKDDETQG